MSSEGYLKNSNEIKKLRRSDLEYPMSEKITTLTCNSCLRSSSFLASDLELLCTSKITAAPATYKDNQVNKFLSLKLTQRIKKEVKLRLIVH